MATLIRTGNGHVEHYFDLAALMMVIFTAQMNGWKHSGDDREIFDKEDSEDLCQTLVQVLPEIEDSIRTLHQEDDICNDCFFNLLVKEHQVELIEDFLEFCQGHPFRINFQN
jgi:hypothetical protein